MQSVCSRIAIIVTKEPATNSSSISESCSRSQAARYTESKKLFTVPAGKTDGIIYDYLDASSALTVSMFRKRLVAYRKMDYEIEAEAGSRANRMSKLPTNFSLDCR